MACFDAEFVVAASQILDESMSTDHHRGSPISLQSAHWSQSRFEAAMIALHAVVGELLGVVKRVGDQFIDHSKQRCSQIRCELTRTAMSNQCALEERRSRTDVSPLRDIDVDHLAVLIYGAVDMPPDPANLDVGLVNEPPIAHTVTTWSRRIDQ